MKNADNKAVIIGISSRSLFNLEKENEIFETSGVEAYQKHQIANENIPLEKGTAFHLIESLLRLNEKAGKKIIEVVVMSRNSPDTGLRILNSICHYGLPITRSAFSSGKSLAQYIGAFDIDLFLSKSEADIQQIIDSGKCAAALIYEPPTGYTPDEDTVRIAFDADAVIFSEESETIFAQEGLAKFEQNEREKQNIPLQEGPFGKFIKLLSKIQSEIPDGKNLIRIAIVTARDYPSNIRLIKTLRNWGVDVDEAFFLGGQPKEQVLKAFNAHIFFDDQEKNVRSAANVVPSSRVPYKKDSPLNKKR